MRITYVALSARGGTSLYSTNLATRICVSEEVLYVAPSHLPDDARPEGADYFPVETGSTHFKGMWRSLLPQSYSAAIRAVREFRPDLIHFTLSHPWNLIFALSFGSTPIVFTVHDPSPHTGAKMAWLTELMHQVLYRRSSRLVTLSRYSRNALPTSPRTKAAIIPHPAFEHYRSKAPITTRDRPVALFFGRITAYKGLNNFCDAAALLLAEGIEADFVIAGQGNIEACLQKGVPPGVAVINRFLEEKEVSKLLASASVLVLPYTDATQSGVLAAAYAAGLPVVATTVGSFPEFVREGVSGLLVPPHQPRALAEAMRRVLTNRVLRQELSRGAEDIARNELNWTIITERHLELYRAIVYPACNQPAPR